MAKENDGLLRVDSLNSVAEARLSINIPPKTVNGGKRLHFDWGHPPFAFNAYIKTTLVCHQRRRCHPKWRQILYIKVWNF